MTINNKIKHFYDGVKMKNNTDTFKVNHHFEIIIPVATAVTLALGAAVVLPIVLTENRKPAKSSL